DDGSSLRFADGHRTRLEHREHGFGLALSLALGLALGLPLSPVLSRKGRRELDIPDLHLLLQRFQEPPRKPLLNELMVAPGKSIVDVRQSIERCQSREPDLERRI